MVQTSPRALPVGETEQKLSNCCYMVVRSSVDADDGDGDDDDNDDNKQLYGLGSVLNTHSLHRMTTTDSSDKIVYNHESHKIVL